MRENEANVQSFGVSATRLKLTAFAVSGALAGFAGAVFVHQQRGLSARSFSSQRSLDVFVVHRARRHRLGRWCAARLAVRQPAELLPAVQRLPRAPCSGALQHGGAHAARAVHRPGRSHRRCSSGLRDAWLRIIAQRRQIVVPSLFADYDPDAFANRLIPLADPDSNSGLAALGPGAHVPPGFRAARRRTPVAQPRSADATRSAWPSVRRPTRLGTSTSRSLSDVVGAALGAVARGRRSGQARTRRIRIGTVAGGGWRQLKFLVGEARRYGELRKTPYGLTPWLVITVVSTALTFESAAFGVAGPDIAQDLQHQP